MNFEGIRSRRQPWLFFLLVFTTSWLCWAAAGSARMAVHHSVMMGLRVAGFAFVAVLAVLLTQVSRNAADVREFWRCNFDPRRISLIGAAVALLLMPVLTFAAVLLASHEPYGDVRNSLVLTMTLPVLLKTFGFTWILGPVLEEIGWRGYALAPIQRRFGLLAGAAIVAFVHAAWHLPMFLIANGNFQGISQFLLAFSGFISDIVFFDLIAAALFYRMGGSALVAMLAHSAFNASAAVWTLSQEASCMRHGFIAAAAFLAAVTLACGRKRPAFEL